MYCIIYLKEMPSIFPAETEINHTGKYQYKSSYEKVSAALLQGIHLSYINLTMQKIPEAHGSGDFLHYTKSLLLLSFLY